MPEPDGLQNEDRIAIALSQAFEQGMAWGKLTFWKEVTSYDLED